MHESCRSLDSTEFRRCNLSTFGPLVLGVVLSVPHVLTAQHAKPLAPKEQSQFGIEDPALQRPVTLPRSALDALSKDERVGSCLEAANVNAEKLHADWFVASEIHLNGPKEADLVVLPDGRLPDAAACFLGANTAQMWVLRKTPGGFKLVLSQIGLGMSVLATKTNGLRDVQIGAAVGGYDDCIDYKFDGASYKIAARTSQPIGAELPHTLTAFRTRKVVRKQSSQSSETIRAQARAWLWQQWKGKKPSHLELTTHDEAADETSSYFMAPDDEGHWEVTIQVLRIVRDDDATASQNRVTEKELLVASELQRVEASTGNIHLPRVISENETLPGSKYRLQFLDWGKRTVATLQQHCIGTPGEAPKSLISGADSAVVKYVGSAGVCGLP